MTGNYICDLCIDIMRWWSNNTSMSYGLINVILFIILNPLLTFIFFIFVMISTNKNVDINIKKIIKIISIVLFLMSILFVFILVFIPILDTNL